MAIPAALDACVVEHLPSWFAALGDAPLGTQGLLRLEFRTSASGKTELRRAVSQGPQRVGRALYPDETAPHMAHCTMQSATPGILQGDRLAVELLANGGTCARVTGQSATKVYTMERGFATQRTHVDVHAGAYLEYVPGYLIPGRGSRLYQEWVCEVSPGGALVFADLAVAGRAAHGEWHDYALLGSRIEVRREGIILWIDHQRNEPHRLDRDKPGVLGGIGGWGTVAVVADPGPLAELAARLDAIEGLPAFTTTPAEGALIVRLTAPSGERLLSKASGVISATRTAILGSASSVVDEIPGEMSPTAGS